MGNLQSLHILHFFSLRGKRLTQRYQELTRRKQLFHTLLDSPYPT